MGANATLNAFYRLAVDLYTGLKTPELVRALCEAMEAFLDVSALFLCGEASFWQWRKGYEKARKEITKQ